MSAKRIESRDEFLQRLELLGRYWHWSTPCAFEARRLIDGSLAPMRFEEGLLYHLHVHDRPHPGTLSEVPS